MRAPADENETLLRPPLRRLQATTAVALLGVTFTCGLVLLGVALIYLFTLTRTVPLTVVDGGEPRTVHTRAETVGDLLDDLNLTLYEGDQLSAPQDALIAEGMEVRVARARTITLTDDGDTQTYRTTLTNPEDILQALGVRVGGDDRVTVDGTQTQAAALVDWPVPANHIEIRRAVDITVVDDGTTREIRTNSETLGDALYEAGVEVFVADEVSLPLSAPVEVGMRVEIARGVPATVVADGTTVETRTRAETVGGLLADSGVALMGLDYAIPNESVAVQPGMTVRVMRVTEEIVGTTEVVPFGEVSQADDSLELDEVRLVQAGQAGLRRTEVRVRYENGVEVSREPAGSYLVQQPQDRVVAYGTGVVVRSIDTPDGPREYWRTLNLLTTSYHPAALGGDNITATGRVLTKGIVGVDPTVIPYGTELYIPGYGIGVAADTGGPRSTRLWIDLGYDDENWVPWSQYTTVYVLTPVPGDIRYVLPD